MRGTMEITIRVAPDAMSAVLEAIPAPAQRPEGLGRAIEQALKTAKVVKGLDKEALKKVVSLLMSGQAVGETVVARGKPADSGHGGRVEYLVSLEREKVGTQRQSGHIDFRDRGGLPQVKEGQELARILPAAPGESGYTVTGRILKAAKGESARLGAGKNVARQGDTLVARKDGLLAEVQPGRLAVLEVLDLDEVGKASGHVEFAGLVRVGGGVASGYKVKAGALQAANVEAETEVEVEESAAVGGPILGAKMKIGGDLSCSLVRKSEIRCGGDVVVTNEVVESKIVAAGVIRLLSPEGRIVNSELTAGQGVETGRLVSKGRHSSLVTLGLRETEEPDQEEDESAGLRQSRRDLGAELERLEAEIMEAGRRWRRTKNPDLAALIRTKGEYLKELRERLAQVEARLSQEAGRTGRREESRAGEPYLSVRLSADAGLVIKGRRASLTLDRPLQAFKAVEVLRVDPESGKEGWVMATLDPNISP